LGPTGRGGPGATTERGRRTADRLRTAARDVFAEIGYVSARVEDIVSRAEVSHGTFYTYFDNKAAVLEALVREAAERLDEVVAGPWAGDEPRAALERVIGEFLEVYAGEADVLGAWVEAAAIDPDFAALLAETRGEFIDRVARNVAPAAEAGGHDAQTAARALVAMVEGFVIEHSEDARRAPPDLVRTLAAIWHGGLIGLAGGAEPAESP
jgi:AcrR family transcriptional regulator